MRRKGERQTERMRQTHTLVLSHRFLVTEIYQWNRQITHSYGSTWGIDAQTTHICHIMTYFSIISPELQTITISWHGVLQPSWQAFGSAFLCKSNRLSLPAPLMTSWELDPSWGNYSVLLEESKIQRLGPWTHAFHHIYDKDPDIRNRMAECKLQKHAQHVPAFRIWLPSTV